VIPQLFVDSSVHAQSKSGIGAYLFISDLNTTITLLTKQIKTKQFVSSSSTILELETLIWAIDELSPWNKKFVIYTDSQNIVRLPERRERLEKQNYFTRSGKRLKNYILYQRFFSLSDKTNFEIIKVKGHKPNSHKDNIDKIFSLVDNAARKALRELK